jgi:23S rRNA (guanine2445-N2)-methyltransferase / 23S rRNA (guanine2069-N7)-methyltransferase
VSPQVRAKRKKKPSLEYVATCGAGLEDLVAGEVGLLGGTVTGTKPGAVSWRGSLETGYRLCLWSRFASRILLQIAELEAPDTDTLYREAGRLDWDEHLDPQNTFAVFCTLSESPIAHSKYASLRIKDAIVDQFRDRTGRRPSVDVARPGLRLNLHIQGSRAILAVDLAGDSLHRRGYRTAGVEAPMKETLAAAVVHLSGWSPAFSPDGILLDPMCGSGTILIEAAMMYGDTAPGLQRKTFGFMFWPRHDARLWERLVSEAVVREEEGLARPWPKIIGRDADPQAVAAARKNVREAGLEDRIEISHGQLADISRPAENGMVIVNPPYGERLSDREEVKFLYRCLGQTFRKELHGWQVGFFASNPDFASIPGIPWAKTYKLFNGPIKCKLHCAVPERQEERESCLPRLHPLSPGREGEDFANRLRKNCSSLFPWAGQENITCFRIYDADLPEYRFSVDLYEEWVHVQEYRATGGAGAAGQGRLQTALRVIRELFDIPHSRIFIKAGQKRREGQRKKSAGPKLHEVGESGCRYLVDFTDSSDPGLPLRYRSIRAMVGGMAHGKNFLNLFGGTGTATIAAITGGAATTITVDPSEQQLLRARCNMALNGYGGPLHGTVRQDCLRWLQESKGRYGLILAAPPSFPADRSLGKSFRVQQDHDRFLRLAMNRLTPDGMLFFVTDLNRFRMNPALAGEYEAMEITDRTIPRDFRKAEPAHRCWRFTRSAPATGRA